MRKRLSKKTITGLVTLFLIAVGAVTNIFTFVLESADITNETKLNEVEIEADETAEQNGDIINMDITDNSSSVAEPIGSEVITREILKILSQRMRERDLNDAIILREYIPKTEDEYIDATEIPEISEISEIFEISETTAEPFIEYEKYGVHIEHNTAAETIEYIDTDIVEELTTYTNTNADTDTNANANEQNTDPVTSETLNPTELLKSTAPAALAATEAPTIIRTTERPPDNAKIVNSTDDEWISLGEYTLTAYCACVECCEIWSAEHPSHEGTGFVQRTASGTIAKSGRTIAVNPQAIPYGTQVLIRYNGTGQERQYIAEDTGSAMRKRKVLDIYMDSHEEALRFGVKKGEIFVKK